MEKAMRRLYTGLLILWDFISVALSIFIVYKLDLKIFDRLPEKYENNLLLFTFCCFGAVLVFNFIFKCYNNVWRYASMLEASRILLSVGSVAVAMFVADRISQYGLSIAIIIVLSILFLFFMTLGRMSVRFFRSSKGKFRFWIDRKNMSHVIIYGAGEAGSFFLRKLNENPENNLMPVAFLDDDKTLWGCKVNGIKVVGGFDKLAETIDKYDVDEVIISITNLKSQLVKDVLGICKDKYCSVRKFALVEDLDEDTDVSKIPISNLSLKPVNLDELLRRDSIHLNMQAVKGFIKDKVILVTGGAGSIGSEICRQVLKYGAKKLLVFDIHENGLFDIRNELLERYDESRFEMLLGSIRDRDRLKQIFDDYKPTIVFHAAAHKHVPMMEANPREAIKNNVFGTINVAQAAIFAKAEKFILISTDKAVNPTNIMGASKRVAEMVIQMFNQVGTTELAAVRFGNVLGSNGSVVPTFRKQIASGGPVTVTHPDIERFFMTIPEAVQLVLEAGAMASGGEIFVLDMGKPVKIYDLACDLIKLSGLRPEKDIKIVFTGLRPGEKLYEELSMKGEPTSKTENDKIYVCQPIQRDLHVFATKIKELDASIHAQDEQQMFQIVKELVETFQHKSLIRN